jgi:hypothetical protein
MNLVAPEFSRGQIASHHDGTAGTVHFNHVIPSLRFGDREQLFEHFDDVFGRVIVVIEQHDVIERRVLVACFPGCPGGRDRSRWHALFTMIAGWYH